MDDQKENLAEIDKSLWSRYHKTRSISDRNKLVEQYLPWARHKAFKLIRKRRAGVSVDDYISEAAIGLIKAVEKYDPSHGVRFFAYASQFVYGGIMNYIALCGRYSGWRRDHPQNINLLSLDDDISEYNKQKYSDEIIDKNADNPVDRCQQQELKKFIFQKMPRRDKRLLQMIYYKGMTQGNIAKRLKRSGSSISRIKQEAFGRLKGKPELQEYWLMMVN